MPSTVRNTLFAVLGIALFVMAAVLFGANGIAGLLILVIVGAAVIAIHDELRGFSQG